MSIYLETRLPRGDRIEVGSQPNPAYRVANVKFSFGKEGQVNKRTLGNLPFNICNRVVVIGAAQLLVGWIRLEHVATDERIPVGGPGQGTCLISSSKWG